jgi:hypothetical protein
MTDLKPPIAEYLKPTDSKRILAWGEQAAIEWSQMPEDGHPNWKPNSNT